MLPYVMAAALGLIAGIFCLLQKTSSRVIILFVACFVGTAISCSVAQGDFDSAASAFIAALPVGLVFGLLILAIRKWKF